MNSEGDIGLILVNPKYVQNLASSIRAASCFGAKRIVWTGTRIRLESFDRVPREMRMKDYKDVIWKNDSKNRPFDLFPSTMIPVCVERLDSSESLATFIHPKNALYVFGPEDGSVPQVLRRFCHRFVHIDSRHSMNLAATVNVLLYDRQTKES